MGNPIDKENNHSTSLRGKQHWRLQRIAIGLIAAELFALIALLFVGITTHNWLEDADAAEQRRNQAQTLEAGIQQSLTPLAESHETLTAQISEGKLVLRDVEESVTQQESIYDSLFLASEAAAILRHENADSRLAVLLAIRAIRTAYTPQADKALILATERMGTSRHFWGHTTQVTDVSFSPDGQFILTASSDRTVRLWNNDIVRSRFIATALPGWHNTAAFSPDGQTILTSGQDILVALWNTSTGERLREFDGHTDHVRSSAFAPDGSTVLTSSLNEAILWDVATGYMLFLWDNYNFIGGVAFSPDGSTVAAASGSGLVLWNAKTGQEVNQMLTDDLWLTDVSFSPDGQTILVGGDSESALLFDVDTGELILRFEGHVGWIWSVAFSPDGQMASTGSMDGTIRLWDVDTGSEARVFYVYSGGFNVVNFSPDGKRIVVGSGDGSIRVWEVDYLNFVDYVCTQVGRDFTPYERQLYHLDDRPTCP